MTVLKGANYGYRLQSMNGYVMWHLEPCVQGYRGAHITISDDVGAAVGSWNHLTLQNVGVVHHTYFSLVGTSYTYKTRRRGRNVAPSPYYLGLAKSCVYDLQLLGKLTHSDDFKADQVRQAEERAAALVAAAAAKVAAEEQRIVDEAAFTQKIAARRAAGGPAWG